MPREASILVTLRDQYSAGINTMRSANDNFGRSTDQVSQQLRSYQTRLNALVEQQGKLSAELIDARKELKEAEKAYRDTGEAADAEALNQARQKYEALKIVMNETTQASRNTQNALRELDGQQRRSGGGSGSGATSALAALGKAGLGQMAGDAAQEIANTLIGSSLGDAGGAFLSSGLSGAISGAAMGSLAGPIGTAIGAVVGGTIGLVQGGTQMFQGQDEAFKSYYQGLYEQGQTAAGESLSAGSDTAAQRELDAIAFNRLLGEGVGDQYLERLRTLAADTPLEYSGLTSMSRALATGFGDTPERMLELITAIGDAGSAVGVTASDMETMAQALSRMNSSGKATLEYLNIFQDRGVDVIGMLGDAMGKTQGQIYDMISKGEINGQDAANIIQAGMESLYGGAMETMASTFSGLTSTLEDTLAELDNARGEGYNAERTEGLQAEIDAYGGQLGQAVEALNTIAGQNEAYLENLSEQYTREALSAVLLGQQTSGIFDADQQKALEEMRDQFLQASADYENGSQEAGLQMDSLRRQAEALATVAYESSEQYQTMHETELDLIAAIRENTAAQEARLNEYEIQQEMSKGLGAASYLGIGTSGSGDTGDAPDPRKYGNWRRGGYYDDAGKWHSYASGLGRVPYDNYPAVLHQGERVLTAAEARSYNRGGGGTIQIVMNGTVIREEADVERIGDEFLSRLIQARVAGVYK